MTEHLDIQNNPNPTSLAERGYLSLRVLAEKYGYAKDHISSLARSGRIQAVRYGSKGEWFALEDSVASYRSSQKARFENLVQPRVSAKPKSDDLAELVSQLREIVSSANSAQVLSSPVLSHKGSLNAEPKTFRRNTVSAIFIVLGGILFFSYLFTPATYLSSTRALLSDALGSLWNTSQPELAFSWPISRPVIYASPSPTPSSPRQSFSDGGSRLPLTPVTQITRIREIVIQQTLPSAEHDRIVSEIQNQNQLSISPLQYSVALLTADLQNLRQGAARTFQAPLPADLQNTAYPNAVSFSKADFSGPVRSADTLTVLNNFIVGTNAFNVSTETGYVGIGTLNPSTALEISGIASISSNLTVGGNLTVNGSGTSGNQFTVTGSGSFSGNLNVGQSLTVGSNITVGGSGTVGNQFAITGSASIGGRLLLTKAPTMAHTGTWPSFTGLSEAPLYINPASVIADGNIFGYAVNGTPKFLVDAEGDIYGTNLILTGNTTTATSTVGDLTVEGNSQFGDAVGDKIRFVGTVLPKTLSSVAFTIQASASQTADLFKIIDADSNSLFKISNLGNASISSNFEISGYASVSKLFGANLSSCTGQNALQWSTTGLFACTQISTGLKAKEGSSTILANSSILNFNAGAFSLLASGSTETLISLDYTNGPASRSIAQTISGLWTFTYGSVISSSSGNVDFMLRSSTTNGATNNDDAKFRIMTASTSESLQIRNGANTTLLSIASASGNFAIKGPLTATSGNNMRIQASGTATGSTGSGSIYFLDSSGTTRGRVAVSTTASVIGTGGTITTDGNYEVHTFTTSGTFTLDTFASVSYLVVGGGGGGGSYAGGGGGGGGVKSSSSYAIIPGRNYGVAIGTEGTGGTTSSGNHGTTGGDSTFDTVTAHGGGWGGGSFNGVTQTNGGNGGSGGASGGGNSNGAPGTGTAGEGNDGGDGNANFPTNYAGGGGGGAGSVGSNGSGNNGGNGGTGISSSISGSPTSYGGGGGGGSPAGGTPGTASGGGGAGGGTPSASNGTVNTGGGGGGGKFEGSGGDGGSGVVIIRFLSSAINSYGTLYIGATNTTSADLAEYYVSHDSSLSAGDAVSVADVNGSYGLVKATSGNAIGIVSTNPGLILGGGEESKENQRMVALAGRVPAKVSDENGVINVGDRLTVSKTEPGVIVKALFSGETIGTALEQFPVSSSQLPVSDSVINSQIASSSDSSSTLQVPRKYGTINVFVKVSYWAPSLTMLSASASLDASMSLQMTDGRGFTLSNLFGFILEQFAKIGVTIKDGVVSATEFIANKITTQEVCVDNTCINQTQLDTLLNNAGITPLPSITPSPSATPPQSGEATAGQATPTPEVTPTPSETPLPSDTPSPTPEPTPPQSGEATAGQASPSDTPTPSP